MNELEFWPVTASAYAGQVDTLIWVWTAVIFLFTAPIVILLATFTLRYQTDRKDVDRQHWVVRNVKLELSWLILPFLVTMAFFTWAAVLYDRLWTMPSEALEINAVGRQWMWKFQHPGGQAEINTLHAPIGQPVKITAISEDVIHALYVPALRIKVDVLPGRYRQLWFEADRPGSYRLHCTEFCGTDHAGMGGTIELMEPAAYQAWLETAGSDADLATAGQGLFRSHGCSGCHGTNAAQRAPTLDGLFGRAVPLKDGTTVIADAAYIRDSILLPKKQVVAGFEPIMPTFAGRIDEADLLKLVAYVERLGGIPAAGP